MSKQAFTVKEDAPLLLRRIREVPNRLQLVPKHPDKTGEPVMSHFTMVSSGGRTPEMSDQMEDRYREDG